jgi:hypothetical protein
MAERAAHWMDRVIPWVATRQFVLTIPFKRRWLLARRSDLADGVLQIALRIITRWYRKVTGRTEGKSGSVTAIQRFGSALNLNLHFHIIHLDGVFARGADGQLRFFQHTPSTADIEELVQRIERGCERFLASKGFAGEADDTHEEDDAQGVLQMASLLGLNAVGEDHGKRVRRVQMLGGKEYALPERCATVEGYNLHADVSLQASDRQGLERLCRYVLRPPLALGRLERLPDGRVRVGMKRVFSDGTGAIDLTPLEFVAKLAAIIPPPRANQVVYSGILAGNAAWRPEVVPKVPTSTEAARAERAALRLVKAEDRKATSERAEQALCWAELLRRVFRVEGWQCPHCAKPMKLRSIVIREPATTRVLSGLLKATGPPVAC